jgi:DMSO/TMAO reductase YedYZ molybdopterin-dependent catalytic subunit
MPTVKRLRRAIFASLIIVVVLVVSAVILIHQNLLSNPHSTPSPTPGQSPTPVQNSPTPTHSTITNTPKPTATNTPQPTKIPVALPDEVTQYQGQNLSFVNTYIDFLIAHPDVAIAGTQNIDQRTYRLGITGMVNNPMSYTYDQVVDGFNSTLQVATLPCVEGWSVRLLWQGVLLTDILNATGVSSGANTLIFIAHDGYSSSLPLNYVRENNIMIAYKMNNLTFTPQLGWPFFLVANNQYGYKWVEWITEINVSSNSDYLGYWESRGYPNDATVRDPNLVQPHTKAPSALPIAAVLIASAAFAAGSFILWRRIRRESEN